MKIIERLKIYIDYKAISLNAFDKSIGASNGYIGRQIKNQASVGGDVIEKIFCTYTDINLEWLIAGKGDMIKKNISSSETNEIKTVDNSFLLDRIEKLAIENAKLKEELEQMKSKSGRDVGPTSYNFKQKTLKVAEQEEDTNKK